MPSLSNGFDLLREVHRLAASGALRCTRTPLTAGHGRYEGCSGRAAECRTIARASHGGYKGYRNSASKQRPAVGVGRRGGRQPPIRSLFHTVPPERHLLQTLGNLPRLPIFVSLRWCYNLRTIEFVDEVVQGLKGRQTLVGTQRSVWLEQWRR